MQSCRITGLLLWTIALFQAGARIASAQDLPSSPSAVWESPQEAAYRDELNKYHQHELSPDSTKTYTLTELIDLAEEHNPSTRIAWERAKQAAARLGVSRGSLYPVITTYALLQEGRSGILLDNAFHLQDIEFVQPTVSLLYTVLDFGRRRADIDTAMARKLAANFTFNETHESIIFQVTAAYYQLVSAMEQVQAAEASLMNSQTVQEAVTARLKNGLATLPDTLEAKSATAQAEYDLETAKGAERLARGALAQDLGISPTIVLKVEGIPRTVTPDVLQEPVENAIRRALVQRPDLLAQLALVKGSRAQVRRAKDNYYPVLKFTGSEDFRWAEGLQLGSSRAFSRKQMWLNQLNLSWTLFDGRARYNELDRARSQEREAEAQLEAFRYKTETEVWTAYSNVETATRQQQAADALFAAADQSYQSALTAYKYGVRNFLDVTAAQRTLAQARTGQVIARSRLFTSVADLAFRTGDLLRVGAGSKH
ncbi:MAG TPA: TolC family protein [Bryobacteraceae bacterium]